jgi:hypothetical protein
LPLLTVRLTLPLWFRWLPAFGFVEMTRPLFTLFEKAWPIFPAEQECALSAFLAADSALPFTFGTTQFLSVNFAVTDRAWLAVTWHVLLPVQAPEKPPKLEPLAAFACRVTEVPKANPCEQVPPQLMPAGVLVTVPMPFPDLCTVRVCAGGLVYVKCPVADGAPVAMLSTVSSETVTWPIVVLGGAVTVTESVSPQSRNAWVFENVSACTVPNEMSVTQPRFWPVIVTCVPPVADPEDGVIEVIFGSPGGNRNNTSDESLFADVGGEQSVTVHTCVSTIAGFWATVFVVRSVLLLALKLYCVPVENGDAASWNSTRLVWFAKPEPVMSIGVPPVSGAAGVPAVLPAVATTPETVGMPA